MIIDSHAHLNFDVFRADLDSIVDRAKSVGVSKIVSISTRLEEFDEIAEISEKYDIVDYTVGVHPDYAKECLEKYSLDQIISHFSKHKKCIGIGEGGLDYHVSDEFKKEQKEMFCLQLDFAISQNKPFILHTREAENDTKDIIRSHVNLKKMVVHCFTGTLDFAKFALDMGFYISFSGVVTFKSAKDLKEIAKYVPIDRILIETDAPFLAPEPMRGKTNEPSFVHYTGEMVASLKGISKEELYENVKNNFEKLFFA